MAKNEETITVHISPSTETVSIEHLVQGNITLSPEEAYSVLQRLKERERELHALVAKRQLRSMHEEKSTNELPGWTEGK